MDRRTFLAGGVLGTAGVSAGLVSSRLLCNHATDSALHVHELFGPPPPARGLIPVVGDGKWVWTEPPQGASGYLDPRRYELKVGVQLRGTGPASNVKATTAAPVELPEQRVDQVDVQTQGCVAGLRQLTPESGQLILAARSLARGQVIGAAAHYVLTICKDHRGFDREQFPYEQEFAKAFRRMYLVDSPGIQTRFKTVRQLAEQIAGQIAHPWDRARAFQTWVWENIEGRVQYYTSVVRALKNRVGDCEERAAVFVALCRASGIPARLVWIPNHNWAEFYLLDHQGVGHWIPCHTACYKWFGWTGAHELVLQKGDRILVPEKRRPQRLLADWMQWEGSRPAVRWFAELQPIPTGPTQAAGPGARRKDEKGEWLIVNRDPLDDYLRDGPMSNQAPPRSLLTTRARRDRGD